MDYYFVTPIVSIMDLQSIIRTPLFKERGGGEEILNTSRGRMEGGGGGGGGGSEKLKKGVEVWCRDRSSKGGRGGGGTGIFPI